MAHEISYKSGELWVIQPSWGEVTLNEDEAIFLTKDDADEAAKLSTSHAGLSSPNRYVPMPLAEAIEEYVRVQCANATFED